MRVSILVAAADNGVIGRGGRLPWRLPNDLRRFKQLTMGHTMVMGRRTWESIGRSLAGRRMIVVSRQSGYDTGVTGVAAAESLPAALRMAAADGEEEAFVIGGAEVYREALPLAERLFLTRVEADVEGDTYLPDIDWSDWRLVESERHLARLGEDYSYRFEVYDRAGAEPRERF